MSDWLKISNILSLLRLVLTIPLAYFLWKDDKTAIFIIIIVAALSDFLDGYLARKLDQISELGKILDPIADKTIIAVSGLILVLTKTIPLWFGVAVIARDLIILIAGIYVKAKYKITLTANMLGKVTVNVISISIILAIFFNWNYLTYVFLLATLFMLASLLSYLFNAIRKIGVVK